MEYNLEINILNLYTLVRKKNFYTLLIIYASRYLSLSIRRRNIHQNLSTSWSDTYAILLYFMARASADDGFHPPLRNLPPYFCHRHVGPTSECK